MNYLDVIIVIPVLWWAFRGFKKGLIKEVAKLAALILGLWAASSFSYYLVEVLSDKTEINESYIPLIAFAIIFIVTVILIHLLSGLLDKLIKAVALSGVNKLAGAVFGAAKGVLLLSVIIFLIHQFLTVKLDLIPKEVTESSLLYPYLLDLIEFIYPKIQEIKFDELNFI